VDNAAGTILVSRTVVNGAKSAVYDCASGGSALGPEGGGAQAPPNRGWAPNLAVPFTNCGQLIIRKISKFDATRCQILRLKCKKFDFRWGSVPDPTGGAYSAPQTP